MAIQNPWCVTTTAPFLNIEMLAVLCGVSASLNQLVRKTQLDNVTIVNSMQMNFLRNCLQTLPRSLTLNFSNFKNLQDWQQTVLVALTSRPFPNIIIDRAWFSSSLFHRGGCGNLDITLICRAMQRRDFHISNITFQNSATDDAETSRIYLQPHVKNYNLLFILGSRMPFTPDSTSANVCHDPQYNPFPPRHNNKRQREENVCEGDSDNDEFDT